MSPLTAVQRRNEDNLIPLGQLVLELAFELPVGRVDKDEDPWSTVDDESVQAESVSSISISLRPRESLRTGSSRNVHGFPLRKQFRPILVVQQVLS